MKVVLINGPLQWTLCYFFKSTGFVECIKRVFSQNEKPHREAMSLFAFCLLLHSQSVDRYFRESL
jgi:hypothetical protein